jgi:excisionase family DNA binding protein
MTTMTAPLREYLTATEVADELRVTPNTVRIWLRAGELKGSYLSDRAGWRILREDLDTFVRDRRRE